MKGKKGFVLYFDCYPCIAGLPAGQRGELFSALMEYARAAEEGQEDPAPVLAVHPQLEAEGCMAFRFIAENIRRDTEKWREKQARYQEAAQRRSGREKSAWDWT